MLCCAAALYLQVWPDVRQQVGISRVELNIPEEGVDAERHAQAAATCITALARQVVSCGSRCWAGR